MQVYLFMGTNLPEISSCLDHLIRSSKEIDPVKVHVPAGLEWSLEDNRYTISPYDPDSILWVMDPDQDGTSFILLDPRRKLIPQLEKLSEDLGNCLIEPVKIVTVVDCGKTEQSTRLKRWLDACIYYSDVVLLGNRANASKSFVRDFQKQYERKCYPCLFLFMKGKGIPSDTVEILAYGTRRISQMFDLPESGKIPEIPGVVVESSCDLDLEESEIDPYRVPRDDESAAHVPDSSEFIVYHSNEGGKNP